MSQRIHSQTVKRNTGMGKHKHRLCLTYLFLLLITGIFLIAPAPSAHAASKAEERIIDNAGLFSSKEREGLEQRVNKARDAAGMDLIVLTISDAGDKTAQEYADDYYDDHNFGTGPDHSGALYLIDMDNREIAVSTHGKMIRYLTDKRINRILDAAYEKVSKKQYGASALAAIDNMSAYVRAGIPDGQHNYDSETGKTDYYKKRAITWYNLLFALGLAGILAALPCIATVNKYKMKSEHRQSLKYRMSYRTGSAFEFRTANDLFVNRVVTQHRIQTDSDRGGGSSGRSTTHRSSGGKTHGGGSRKF